MSGCEAKFFHRKRSSELDRNQIDPKAKKTTRFTITNTRILGALRGYLLANPKQ